VDLFNRARESPPMEVGSNGDSVKGRDLKLRLIHTPWQHARWPAT